MCTKIHLGPAKPARRYDWQHNYHMSGCPATAALPHSVITPIAAVHHVKRDATWPRGRR